MLLSRLKSVAVACLAVTVVLSLAACSPDYSQYKGELEHLGFTQVEEVGNQNATVHRFSVRAGQCTGTVEWIVGSALVSSQLTADFLGNDGKHHTFLNPSASNILQEPVTAYCNS